MPCEFPVAVKSKDDARYYTVFTLLYFTKTELQKSVGTKATSEKMHRRAIHLALPSQLTQMAMNNHITAMSKSPRSSSTDYVSNHEF